MSRKRPHSTSPPPTSTSLSTPTKSTPLTSPPQPALLTPLPQSPLFRSTPITDRSSTFIAIYSPTSTTLPQIHTLQSLPELKIASHRPTAWRVPSTQRSLHSSQKVVYNVKHADDGEAYAGKTLAKVLVDLDVTGAVVVGRWFGGVMLGPARFGHMERCARDAVGQYLELEKGKKRVKVDGGEEEGEKEKERLVGILEQRDESITVLRGLLEEKKGGGGKDATGDGAGKASPERNLKAGPDYAKMEVQMLKRLEVARDRTITWILEEIEKVEEKVERRAEKSPEK